MKKSLYTIITIILFISLCSFSECDNRREGHESINQYDMVISLKEKFPLSGITFGVAKLKYKVTAKFVDPQNLSLKEGMANHLVV